MGYKTEAHGHRPEGRGVGEIAKGTKCMMTEDDLTLGDGHTIQYVGDVP